MMVCKQCGKTFDGHANRKFCDECKRERINEYMRRYYAEHRKECRERDKRYYDAHRDEVLEKQKRYRWRKDAPK